MLFRSRGFLEAKREELAQRTKECKQVLERTGIDNPNDRKKLLSFFGSQGVLPKTLKGNRSVAQSALEEIGSAESRAVTKWRSLQHAEAHWIDGMLDKTHTESIIHANLDQAHVISGRLACRSPNLQAIPLKERGHAFGSFGGMFMPRDGYELWEIDYDQAEYRLATAFAQCDTMARMFADGVDIHSDACDSLFGPDQRHLRWRAKRTNFATIYGVSAKTLAVAINIEIEEAERFLAVQRRKYPQFPALNRTTAKIVDDKGYLELYTGRRRFFGPDEPTYKAFSQLVQASIAELVKDAMLDIWKVCEGRDIHQVLQIHDSLIIEISKEELEKGAIPAICAIAENVLPDRLADRTSPPVKLSVSASKWAGAYGDSK